MVAAMLDLYGRRYTVPEAYDIWFEVLREFETSDIKRAFAQHAKAGNDQAPVPATIARILQANDGHPGPEEAWAMVAKALTDESVTIIETDEIAHAFGIALQLSDSPIQARMAFVEAYKAAVQESRRKGVKPNWWPSVGSDKNQRSPAIEQAVRLGRLSKEALLMIPTPDHGMAPVIAVKRIGIAEAQPEPGWNG